MKIIVATDLNFGIGKNNDIPWHLSADLKRFKEKTMGKTVGMGYNTLMSLPGSKPLPGRNNVILYDKGDAVEGCTVVSSPEDFISLLSSVPSEEAYVTGGASVYRLMLPYCDEVDRTVIEDVYDCEVFFPDLGEHPEWVLAEKSETFEENGIRYHFEKYVNEKVSGNAKVKDSNVNGNE